MTIVFIYNSTEDQTKRKNMWNQSMMMTSRHKAQVKALFRAQIQKKVQIHVVVQKEVLLLLPLKMLKKVQTQDPALDLETQIHRTKIMFLKVVMKMKIKLQVENIFNLYIFFKYI